MYLFSSRLNNISFHIVLLSGGPDNMRLSPSTSTYTLNIGQRLGPVVCSADCVPNCTFKWKRESGTDALALTIQDKNDSGMYTCTATRGTSTSFTETRSIMVYVRCKHNTSVKARVSLNNRWYTESCRLIGN